MLIVYRKSDKEIVFNSGKSFVKPEGISDENGKIATVERIGGQLEDYGVFRLHDIDDAEQVDEILAHKGFVNLVFEGDNPVEYTVDFKGYEAEQQAVEELRLIDALKPSDKEILKAEIEISTINLLIENGAI